MQTVSLYDSPIAMIIYGSFLELLTIFIACLLWGTSLRTLSNTKIVIFLCCCIVGLVSLVRGSFHDPFAFMLIMYGIWQVAVGALSITIDRIRNPNYYDQIER